MASLNSLYIKADTLRTLADTIEAKGDKGISITVSISDTGNNYSQNVSAFVSQSKEDREAGKQRYYVGNGNTFWTDGNIQVVKRKEQDNATKSNPQQTQNTDDDLPF